MPRGDDELDAAPTKGEVLAAMSQQVAELRAALATAERRNMLNPSATEYVAELEAELATAKGEVEKWHRQWTLATDLHLQAMAERDDYRAALSTAKGERDLWRAEWEQISETAATLNEQYLAAKGERDAALRAIALHDAQREEGRCDGLLTDLLATLEAPHA